jgi:hypothetical protein
MSFARQRKLIHKSITASGQQYFRLEKVKVIAGQLVDEITSGTLF